MYSFTAYGHKNILATHKTTIEFTKDRELSLRGNCILGVNADFNLIELKKSMKTIINESKSIKNKIKMIINLDGISDEIIAEPASSHVIITMLYNCKPLRFCFPFQIIAFQPPSCFFFIQLDNVFICIWPNELGALYA